MKPAKGGRGKEGEGRGGHFTNPSRARTRTRVCRELPLSLPPPSPPLASADQARCAAFLLQAALDAFTALTEAEPDPIAEAERRAIQAESRLSPTRRTAP